MSADPTLLSTRPRPRSVQALAAFVRAGARSSSTWEYIGIAVFTAWIAWPFIAPGGYVTGYDTASYSGPNLVATYRAWSGLRIPWWESGVFGGAPFGANLQTAVFYPLKVVFWPLGAPAAMGAMTATHLFMLAFGMRHLARRTLGLAAPAGLVAAVVLVGSGTTMVRSVRFEQIAVVAWTPWLLVALDAVLVARPDRRMRAIAVCAAVTALMLLSGHPQQVYISGLLAAVWVVGRLWDLRRHDAGASLNHTPHRIGRVALACLLGATIAALPIVTARPLLHGSALAPDALLEQAGLEIYVLDALRVLPTLFGDAWSVPPSPQLPTPEGPAFLGVAGLALALIGLVTARSHGASSSRRQGATALVLALAGSLSVVLALGPTTDLYRVAAAVVPGFGQGRVPLRWLFITTFAVAMLAAIGTSWLTSRVAARKPHISAIAGMVVSMATIVWTAGTHDVALASKLMWVVAGAAVVAAATARLLSPSDRGPRRALILLAVGLLVLELGAPARHSYGRQLRGDASFIEVSTGAADHFLADQGNRYLVVGASDANVSLTTGGRTLDGYDGGLWLTNEYVAAAQQLVDGPFEPLGRVGEQIDLPVDSEALARLGVRYVVIDPHTRAKARGEQLPDDDDVNAAREELIDDWNGPVLVDGTREVWENPQYRGEAIVYPHGAGSGRMGSDGVPAEIDRPAPGTINVSTNADAGLLVVAEQAQPGWRVSVGGDPAELVEADGFALAVDLPEGEHDVRFHYRPPGVTVGWVLSLAGLVATAALAVLGSRRAARGRTTYAEQTTVESSASGD